LYNITALTFDVAGNLFVAAGNNGSILEYTPSGAQSTFTTGLIGPTGLAFDSAGNLFEADLGLEGNIYEFAPTGARSTFAGMLYSATGLAFDNADNLFVLDGYGGFIYKFTPDGKVTTFACGLSDAYGIAIDSENDLFVAQIDYVQEILPDGTESIFASTSGNRLAFSPTPEPSSAWLMVFGTIALFIPIVPWQKRQPRLKDSANAVGKWESVADLFAEDRNVDLGFNSVNNRSEQRA
jgi:DNA-binding beta-propeller fold protein YncE